jgi:hypothetical protein
MRNEILAWYAYSESGAAGIATLEPRSATTTPGPADPGSSRTSKEPGDEVPGVRKALSGDSEARVIDASRLAELFAAARSRDVAADAQRWQRFIDRKGLESLIDLTKSRRPETETARVAVDLENDVTRSSEKHGSIHRMGVGPVHSRKRKDCGK